MLVIFNLQFKAPLGHFTHLLYPYFKDKITKN